MDAAAQPVRRDRREYDRKRHAANPEKRRASARASRAANLEKARGNARARYAANAEKERARVRVWQAANPEKVRESRRKVYASNAEKVCEKKRKYRAANPEKARERDRKRHAANPEKNRESARKRRTGFSAGLFAAAFALQNNACAVCRRPFSEKLKPHADHDHDTKTPRGIMCNHCNVAEGCVKKTGMSPAAFAASLTAYLASPPARQVLTKKQRVVIIPP